MFLVLTRMANESLMIGDDVEISVLRIRGRRVRLAVRHPDVGERLTFDDSTDHDLGIGDEIALPIGGTCAVVEIRGEKSWLGLTVPPELSVHRKEVYDAIKREGRR